MKIADVASALQSALLSTGLVQPLTVNSGKAVGGITIMCRQVPGQEPAWLKVVQDLLFAARTNGFEILIARRYVLLGEKMVFGWFLQLYGGPKDVEHYFEMLRGILEDARPTLSSPLPPSQAPYQNAPQPQPPVQEQPPRVPSQPQPQQPRGTGERTFSPRVIQSGFDQNTQREIEVIELPLPNTSKDLNKPSKPVWSEEHNKWIGGGKGATNVSA